MGLNKLHIIAITSASKLFRVKFSVGRALTALIGGAGLIADQFLAIARSAIDETEAQSI
jgi:hypothetical protein